LSFKEVLLRTSALSEIVAPSLKADIHLELWFGIEFKNL